MYSCFNVFIVPLFLDYLRDVIELLLFIVLPAQDFQSKPMTFLVREILACYILKPMLDMFSDPDYVNQNISWLVSDFVFFFFGYSFPPSSQVID